MILPRYEPRRRAEESLNVKEYLSQIQTFAAKAAENQGKISDEKLFETAESVATEIYGDTQPFARDLAAYARANRDMDIGENELKAMVRDYRFRYGQSVAEYSFPQTAPFGVLFAFDFSTTFILHFGVKNVV